MLGGLIVGILDGLDAIIYYPSVYGITVKRLFQHIASGVLGMQSFRYGWLSAMLGIGLHFLISLIVVSIYYVLSRRFHALVSHPMVCGSMFGLAVYVSMQSIVLPLSRIPNVHHSWGPASQIVNELIAHVLFVGLPSAWIARQSAF